MVLYGNTKRKANNLPSLTTHRLDLNGKKRYKGQAINENGRYGLQPEMKKIWK